MMKFCFWRWLGEDWEGVLWTLLVSVTVVRERDGSCVATVLPACRMPQIQCCTD